MSHQYHHYHRVPGVHFPKFLHRCGGLGLQNRVPVIADELPVVGDAAVPPFEVDERSGPARQRLKTRNARVIPDARQIGNRRSLHEAGCCSRRKQGEQKEATVEVERSADFKQDVTLTFQGDKGVAISPPSYTVKASSSDTKVKVMVSAEMNAPIGEAVVHVTAKPESGDSTTAQFKVNVKGP